MSHFPVAREVEQRRRWRAAAERAVVADICPEPRCLRPSLRQEGDRGVVAVEAFGRQNMVPDQGVDRCQSRGAGTDLVGQRREAEVDAFLGVALGLPVERLVLPELLEQNHRQQVRTGPSPRRRMERCWRLADLLADLHDAVRTTAEAGCRCLDHHPITRQVLRERFAHRSAALEAGNRRGVRISGGNFILGGSRFEFFELHRHLVDQYLILSFG